MRVFCLVNNWVGWQVLRYLQAQGEEIVGLAVHPSERRKYGDEILRDAGLDDEAVFDGSQVNLIETATRVSSLNADICLSVFFGYKLKSPFIDLFPAGVINLHPAFLPYNRGANPNVWSIVDNTPAGATLHFIDRGIDSGDIISQRQVEAEPTDTGQSLYRKLEACCLDLFRDTWPQIRDGVAPRTPQDLQSGTAHRVSDLEQIDQIHLDRSYNAGDLIDLLRARTFPPYPGAYFMHQGRKIYLRLQLIDEEKL